MQDLLGGMDNAGSKSRDNELAKVMFEGTNQYRKKLKLPEMNAHAEKIKSEVRMWSTLHFGSFAAARLIRCRTKQAVNKEDF